MILTKRSIDHCIWEYGDFGECSLTCGGGEKVRFPIIIQFAEPGGIDCPQFVHDRIPDTMVCNPQACPRELL